MALAKSGTLTPSSAASITATGCDSGLWIYNRSQTGTIWARVDGTAATIAGDDCYPVLSRRFMRISPSHNGAAPVSLISSAALEYTVEARSEGGPE